MKGVCASVVLLALTVAGASAATIPITLGNMGDYDWTKVTVNRYDPSRIASVTEKADWGVPGANCFSFSPEKSKP